MKYIDITTNASPFTQNVLAMDLIFETTTDANINLSSHSKNLKNMHTLSDAMLYLDNLSLSAVSSGSGTISIQDQNGVSYNPSVIVFDEVNQINTTTVNVTGSLDRVINNINDRTVIYEGAAATSHTFNHNLNSEFLKINVWVKETVGWQNSIVPITIVDQNTIIVLVSVAKQIRIIVEDINHISKTYGI